MSSRYLCIPKAGIRSIISSLILIYPLSIAHAVTYNVAQNHSECSTPGYTGDGSTAHPFCTLKEAAAVASAGDEVLIKSGRYGDFFQFERSGTAGQPITFTGIDDDVVIGAFFDVPDSQMIQVEGYSNVYEFTIPASVPVSDIKVFQTKFPPILVDDPNSSKFTMKDSFNGEPLPLNLSGNEVSSISDVNNTEGTFIVENNRTVYVHPYGGRVPSDTETDFVIGTHDYGLYIDDDVTDITLKNLRIHYISSMFQVRGQRITVQDIVSTVPFFLYGSNNYYENLTLAHGINRRKPMTGDWFTGNTGTSIVASGSNNIYKNVHAFHSWNVASGGGIDNVIDNWRIHGGPNHCWLPKATERMIVRGLVEYNCQDYQYYDDVRNGYVVENSTFPGGILLQAATGNKVLDGKIVYRNNLFLNLGNHLILFSSTYPPSNGCSFEKNITFENNIFLMDFDDEPTVRHCPGEPVNYQDYPYSEYIQKCQDGTLSNCINFRNNIVLDSNQVDATSIISGGGWNTENDEWDVKITSEQSPAYDAGLRVTNYPTQDSPEIWPHAFPLLFDSFGNPRIMGAQIDIGTHEYCNPQQAESCNPSEIPNDDNEDTGEEEDESGDSGESDDRCRICDIPTIDTIPAAPQIELIAKRKALVNMQRFAGSVQYKILIKRVKRSKSGKRKRRKKAVITDAPEYTLKKIGRGRYIISYKVLFEQAGVEMSTKSSPKKKIRKRKR